MTKTKIIEFSIKCKNFKLFFLSFYTHLVFGLWRISYPQIFPEIFKEEKYVLHPYLTRVYHPNPLIPRLTSALSAVHFATSFIYTLRVSLRTPDSCRNSQRVKPDRYNTGRAVPRQTYTESSWGHTCICTAGESRRTSNVTASDIDPLRPPQQRNDLWMAALSDALSWIIQRAARAAVCCSGGFIHYRYI